MAPLPLSSVYSFVAGFVQNSRVLRVLAQADALNAKRALNTTLMKFSPGDNQKFSFHLQWTATKIVAIEHPHSVVLAAGPNGSVNVGSPAGDVTEQIGSAIDGPSVNGLIRDLRVIGDTVFATGMGRQVYERKASGVWVPRHAQILLPASLNEVRGFNAIHGLDASDVIAGGWFGEIYRRKKNAWSIEKSGTNLIINDVHVAPDGTCFAAGQRGLLLRNSGSGWQPIDHQATDAEIRSLQWFLGKLFVATDDELFAMNTRGKIKPISIRPSRKSTFDSLHANDGTLLSVGAKDVWFTRDAKKWQRLD